MPKPKLIIKQPEVPPLRLCNKCGGEEFVYKKYQSMGKCAFCNSPDLRLAKEGETAPSRMLIATGPFGFRCAMTREDMNLKISNTWPGYLARQGHTIQLWDCPRSAYVPMSGGIRQTNPEDKVPQLVMEIKT